MAQKDREWWSRGHGASCTRTDLHKPSFLPQLSESQSTNSEKNEEKMKEEEEVPWRNWLSNLEKNSFPVSPWAIWFLVFSTVETTQIGISTPIFSECFLLIEMQMHTKTQPQCDSILCPHVFIFFYFVSGLLFFFLSLLRFAYFLCYSNEEKALFWIIFGYEE